MYSQYSLGSSQPKARLMVTIFVEKAISKMKLNGLIEFCFPRIVHTVEKAIELSVLATHRSHCKEESLRDRKHKRKIWKNVVK
jgi:hypothetical protein